MKNIRVFYLKFFRFFLSEILYTFESACFCNAFTIINSRRSCYQVTEFWSVTTDIGSLVTEIEVRVKTFANINNRAAFPYVCKLGRRFTTAINRCYWWYRLTVIFNDIVKIWQLRLMACQIQLLLLVTLSQSYRFCNCTTHICNYIVKI